MGLAGPKTKQRIQVDPRNKSWSDDKSKFGFKMLSKMGWAEGKGLGLREDGQVDHIKVRLKIDSLGVGADKKTADNWLGNNDAFSTLLDGMNKRINGDGSVVPAESSKEDVVEEKPKEDKLSKVLTQGRL
ncbi:PIN2/TERF1-interacting telomerase inhibitor 1 [Nowakowskiella sp. JEL0407]|nr:PIN2/TERF1-interacting telomerase inhibitor 1 [Nowakowskiella sp. JEL0407]